MRADDVNQQRISWIQYGRGLAALLVALSHLGDIPAVRPAAIGPMLSLAKTAPVPDLADWSLLTRFLVNFPVDISQFGVALFFLISGFVIPMSLQRQSLAQFFVQRIFRIWPVLIVCTLIVYVTLEFNAQQSGMPSRPIGALLSTLLMLRDVLWYPALDVSIWTLEVEVKFYVFCVLLAPWIMSADPRVLFVCAMMGLIALVAGQTIADIYKYNFWIFSFSVAFCTFAQFCTYMLIGTLFYWHRSGKISTKWLICGTALLLLEVIILWRFGYYRSQGWSKPSAFIIAAAVFSTLYAAGSVINKLNGMPHRVLNWLGDISYPLYLVNGIFGMTLVSRAMYAGVPPYIAIYGSVAAVLALAWVIHVLVERPMLRLGRTVVDTMPTRLAQTRLVQGASGDGARTQEKSLPGRPPN